MNIAQVGSIILRLPSKESRMDFLINLLLPQDKTSLDSPLVISFSTFILSNRCVSHGCCKDWKIDRLNPINFHDLWHLWLAVCWTLWKLENWPKLLTQLDCRIYYGLLYHKTCLVISIWPQEPLKTAKNVNFLKTKKISFWLKSGHF